MPAGTTRTPSIQVSDIEIRMDVSLSVREYVQNQVGQVLKEMETLEWSDWEHTRLDDFADCAARRELKDKIISSYPGLLSGPHGSRLRTDPTWLPEYVVSAKISRDTLKRTPHASDLDVCNVVWRHEATRMIALSLFNNHLDSNAHAITFVTSGASTSRESLWAPGQNGMGFMTATQFFREFVDKVQQESCWEGGISPGISFRVGHDIGEVSWDKNTCPCCRPTIIVKLDELFPFTALELMEKKGLTEQDAAMEVASMARRRMLYNMSRSQATAKCEEELQQGLFREHSIVESDEVSITIVGLPSDITPEVMFCGAFGLFKSPQLWTIPNALFQFFTTPGNIPLFYYRGQLMPSFHTGLVRVGINYHGTLEICPETSQVKKDHVLYRRYQHLLQEAIQYAFCHLPELAVELARDILAKLEAEEQRNFEIFSPKHGQDSAYRFAFCSAWKRMGSDPPRSKRLYPYSESAPQDLRLIEEFDMIGQSVPSKVMELVIVPSGAFLPIKEYAEGVFLGRRGVGSSFVGFVQFRHAMTGVFSWATNSDIVMVDYTNSYPKVLWDDRAKQFVLGIPYCALHPEDECSCWLSSYLLEARNAYCKRSTNKDKTEVAALSHAVFFRAYALAMGADSKQVDCKAKGALAKKRKASPSSKLGDQQGLAKRPRSDIQHEKKASDSTQGSDMEVARSSNSPSPARLPPLAELAVEPTLVPPTPTDPGNTLSHPLAELLKPIMCAYDRCSNTVSSQATGFEIQRQHFIADNVRKEKEILTLRAQVAEERAKAQCFRAQLQAVQTERDQTRDLLVAKWRQSK